MAKFVECANCTSAWCKPHGECVYAEPTRPAANVEAEPVAATREWANSLANIRQGQRDTPRCEPPTEFEVNRAFADIKAVLQATTPLYPASALEQVRKDALEEAAKVALTHMEAVAQHEYGKRIAAAIRTLALKDQAHG